jgi:hypothetical protein
VLAELGNRGEFKAFTGKRGQDVEQQQAWSFRFQDGDFSKRQALELWLAGRRLRAIEENYVHDR